MYLVVLNLYILSYFYSGLIDGKYIVQTEGVQEFFLTGDQFNDINYVP